VKEQVHQYIGKQRLLRPGERVAAAVSGGADSVALLRVLFALRNELGIVLSVAHFHHGIRGPEADLDRQFVRDLAARLELEFHSSAANVPAHAQAQKLSLETAARELRYAWLEELVRENKADRVATAHTLDDQAETVLMRILRGAASRGLAGIFPEQRDKNLVRPLLAITRSEVEAYLVALKQPWREDSTNRDLSHTRNRIRHQLLPVLEREFNAGVKQTLADLAEVAREEAAYWDVEVASLITRLVRPGKPSRSGRNTSGEAGGVLAIDLKAFQMLPVAIQRHTLHAIARRLDVGLEFKHIQHLLDLFQEKGSSKLVLPGRYVAVRTFREVQFGSSGDGGQKPSYAYRLPIPGEVTVRELRSIFRARIVPGATEAGAEFREKSLLNRDLLGADVKVRNWRAGDRFFPARTRSPKKLKELLQADRLGYRPSPVDRALWPVVEARNQIVWVRGFAAPEALSPNGGEAVLIEEQKIAG
jgi:tRNA(Ile)-lysidine synthase